MNPTELLNSYIKVRKLSRNLMAKIYPTDDKKKKNIDQYVKDL